MEHGKHVVVASWELVPMVNCCGIVVSTAAYVSPDFRGKGLGTLFNTVRLIIAKEAGYSVILCTDWMENAAQRAILNKNGWKDVYMFNNSRTTHDVAISVLNLDDYDFS